MTKFSLTLATSLVALMAAESSLANGAPADCCDKVADLEARVDRLDAKAVEGTTKKILISGHVNRAIQWLDNGTNSNTAHVDNANSETRLTVHGFAKLSNTSKVGLVVETGFNPNSSLVNQAQNAQNTLDAGNAIKVRVADVYFQHAYGRLTLGHGHMASDRTMEDTDLSGTRAAANGASAAGRTAGGSNFADNVGPAAGFQVREYFSSADGVGRRDRVRYDSPTFAGFTLSASHGYQNQGDVYDVALRYAGEFGGFRVAAQAAYSKDKTRDDTTEEDNYGLNHDQFNGSIGVLMPFSISGKDMTGVSLHFAAAHRDREAFRVGEPFLPNGTVYTGKVGFQDHFMNCGKTAVAVDYGYFKGMGFENLLPGSRNKAKTYGVTIVQHIDKAATELYAGYRQYKINVPTLNDIKSVTFGARVKF